MNIVLSTTVVNLDKVNWMEPTTKIKPNKKTKVKMDEQKLKSTIRISLHRKQNNK